ncbi:LacI family DNA-binding transcriptional regulator [Mesorhizobium sp. BAC0120]|uniref:LacI family DNA-binding transcriptional regulator n=1 Tax=Mesorhizobium sp. BAC0120 TaxID=3090670 RepID=UPI00298C7475|nr:LacI family DNA-binding transcriptional regulator [Mesorhizobium sp. BAC0120]MDW6023534.1 LacI family DNA-binding transcriptional regulator [Mesorhizobium sp. BAC0120]
MSYEKRLRSPTIKDVAEAAGVSSATVSYVLNNLNKVTPEVDAHVRRIARELGYQRNRAATALKTGRSHAIGCIVPSLVSPVFPEITQAVQLRAEEHGFATFVIDSGGGVQREAQAARTLFTHGVDGAVAVLSTHSSITDPPLFPLVAIDRQIVGLDSVQADHHTGGRLMAEHAFALGHRKIGLLSGEQDLASSRERRDGFLEGARGRLDIVWDIHVPLLSTLPREATRAIARRKVSLIACVNDLVAISALSVLRKEGIDVPSEVSVIGFDDMQWSAWPLIGLTTIRQPLAELGRRAVDLLIRRLDEPKSEIENMVLPVSLVQRASTAPFPSPHGC